MKSIFTFVLVCVFGTAVFANDAAQSKVDTIAMGIVLESGTYRLGVAYNTIPNAETNIVRLYRRENTKIVKALSFTTKYNRSKMA